MITAAQARSELASVHTKEQLIDLIRRIDWRADGSITVLYSGITATLDSQSAGSLRSGELAVSLWKSGNDVRIIDQSEVGKFLNMIDDQGRVDSLLADKLDEIFKDNPDDLSAFLYGSKDNGVRQTNSIWDELSARFAVDAVGDVLYDNGRG